MNIALLLPVLFLPVVEPDAEPVVETAPPLNVGNAWVREAPPVADVLAAYAVFCNDGDQAVTIAGAESEDFDRVEMHIVVERGDAVIMEESNSVVIGPDDCVAFAPGGRHFMLFDPVRIFRAGDEVELTLHLADGQELELVFPVRRAEEMLDANDHAGHH